MKFKFDFSEVTEFYKQVANYNTFRKYMRRSARLVASYLKVLLKQKTPYGETGELIRGWDENSAIKVNPVKDGFNVTLLNKVPYAAWVNDGHRVRNRQDGPYLRVKKRIKVPSPYPWQENTSDWYVFGHFFVERAVIQAENGKVIEDIIFEQIEQWWEAVSNGK